MVVETESSAAVDNRRVCSTFCWSVTGDTLRYGGRTDPRTMFERYVVQYDVPVSYSSRAAASHGRRAPRRCDDPARMSTCIVVPAAFAPAGHPEVVGARRRYAGRACKIIVVVTATGSRGLYLCGECVRRLPTPAPIFEFISPAALRLRGASRSGQRSPARSCPTVP